MQYLFILGISILQVTDQLYQSQLRNQKEKKIQMSGTHSIHSEPVSLLCRNQEYAFIVRCLPSLKVSALYHDPITINSAST